jgi:putative ABC transport system permease protein
MIKNYVLVLLRTIRRHAFHSAINVLCLTVGITFTMLIGFFIYGELQVNQSLKEVDRLFLMENRLNGKATNLDFFTPPILPKLATEQHATQFSDYYRFWDRNMTLSKGDKHFRIQGMIGDASFLRIFGFKVLHGNPDKALDEPNSVIITEDVAKRFFNKTDVVDETLSVSTEQNGIREYRITAVIAEPDQKNTVSDLMDMNAQVFLSIVNVNDFFATTNPDTWQGGIITYVKLAANVSKAEAERVLNEMLQKEAPKGISENRVIHLNPLTDHYLIINQGAVMKLIIALTVVVIFILVLAITNFINISIASSFGRLKEVGVRKVIGGSRKQVVLQFLVESLILATIAAVLSLGLYQILHPFFNTLLQASLPSVRQFSVIYRIFIVAGVFVIGLLAGAYPAFFQSASKPIESLKGKAKSVQGTISFSRVLITLQFSITAFVLIAAGVLSKQTRYFFESDLGYDGSNVIVVTSVPRSWTEEGFRKMDEVINVFSHSANVKAVSLSWGAPGWGIAGFESTVYKGEQNAEAGIQTYVTGVDENFDNVYDLKMLDGYFIKAEDEPLTPRRVTLNESASKALAASVGDEIKFVGADSISFVVAGIVKDFHYEAMTSVVKPVVFMHNRDFASYRFISFDMHTTNPLAIVEQVERLWKDVLPDEAFTYHFADERLAALYATELQLKKASSVAIVMMTIIVMTGLLGLVSLSVSKRNKEIGIRKVLGATVQSILLMLSGEYLRLMIIAFVVAIPVAYYFTTQWLENYAYHIDLHLSMFLLPGIILMLITLLLVAIQSYGTASANPVKSLRQE